MARIFYQSTLSLVGGNNTLQPTERFSNRVDTYLHYRPSYPVAILDGLATDTGYGSSAVIADIGSGTGLLTRLFLERGHRVYAVEPNQEMRESSERMLSGYAGFKSQNGSAEATTLPAQCVDLIIVGQAFHWFDLEQTGLEFRRILKPQGWIALIWNRRREDTPFLKTYEALLCKHGTDYTSVKAKDTIQSNNMDRFFGEDHWQFRTYPNVQILDRQGLLGRVQSCSYIPAVSQPGYEEMVQDLNELFHAHQQDGVVTLLYETQVFSGRFSTFP